MTGDFEDMILELIEFYEGRGIPKHKQIGAALGFAAYLVTQSTDPVLLAKYSMGAFNEMIQKGTQQ